MTTVSFALRALAALALLVGFYVLAAAMALGLAYIPYAEVVYTNRISPKLWLLCLAASFGILRASFFVPRPAFHAPGPEILESEQPALFALIRDVAGQMQTRMPAHVYLIPDVNAFVGEIGGFLGFGSKRIMGIGLGLLHVDDTSELRATVAHEFGHYAGGHTRLGGMVYATRAAIGNVLASLGRGVLSKPFEAYAKFYLLVTRSLGRRQELEADRAGVLVAGRDAHIEGLTTETRAGLLFGSFVGGELAPLLRAGMCPQPLFAGFLKFVAAAPAADVDRALAERKPDRYDTHPALPERIEFARRLADPGVVRDRRPAIELLRDPVIWEERVEPYLFNQVGATGALRRIPWDDVVPAFYAPRLAEEARVLGERLYPVLGAGPKYGDVLRALAGALGRGERSKLAGVVEPKLAGASGEGLAAVEELVLGRALGVLLGAALVERGGEWVTNVSEDLTVRHDGVQYKVFDLGRKAVTSPRELPDVVFAGAVDAQPAAAYGA